MLKGLAALVVLIALLAGGWLWYMSDAQVARRAYGVVNERLNTATASRDVPALSQFLKETLSDDAIVSIKVQPTVMGLKSNTVLMSQDFTKPDFIRFVELTLEPTESYTLTTRIENIEQGADGRDVVHTYASGNGRAGEYMRGVRVPMVYTLQTRCQTQAKRDGSAVSFVRMVCDIGLGQRAESLMPADAAEIMKRATGVAP